MRHYDEWHGDDAHAVGTIEFARAVGLKGCVLADDLRELHKEMCRERGWLPKKWNPVARAISLRTTGGKKIYAHIEGRRLRVYPLHTDTTRSTDPPPSAQREDSFEVRRECPSAA